MQVAAKGRVESNAITPDSTGEETAAQSKAVRTRNVQIPEDLSQESQRAKVDSLTREYASKIAELQEEAG